MSTLLQIGETCWRRERASRFAVLLDNESYFTAVLSSLERAQSSILLVGWEFDPRTALRRDSRATMQETRIGDVLRTVSARRPQLDVRILVWDMSLPISVTRAFYPRRARAWFDDRVKLLLDDRHPIGACRHQKLVIVDASVAFCTGTDFGANRWDSVAHLDQDARRLLPSGRRYRPRHAVGAVIAGPAARALFELAAARWHHVSGEYLRAVDEALDPWPEGIPPLLRDVETAIARTEPGDARRRCIREIESLCLTCIAAARELIYIEDQYFAAPRIADALKARLAERAGPQIIVICPERGASMFDRALMDPSRHAIVRRLQRCDPHRRLGVYAPVTSDGRAIVVHSKLLCIDNRLLRIGSANLSNRSMGLDGECDLAVDSHAMPQARRAEAERAIEQARRLLISHHLGVSADELLQLIRDTGSTLAAMRESSSAARARVCEVRPESLGPLRSLIARYHLGDPRSSEDSWRPWRRNRTA